MGKKPPIPCKQRPKEAAAASQSGLLSNAQACLASQTPWRGFSKGPKRSYYQKMSRSNCLAIAFGCSCFFFVQELAGLHASLQRQCDPEPHFTGNVRNRRNRHALQKSNTSHSHTKHKSAGLAGVSNRVWLGDASLVCSVIWLVWPKLELIYRLLEGFLVRLGTTPCSEGSWARFFRGAAGFGGASDNC